MPDFVDEFLLVLKLSKEVTESFSNLLVVTAPTIDHRSFLGRTYLLGAQGTIKKVTQTFFLLDPLKLRNNRRNSGFNLFCFTGVFEFSFFC